MCILLSFIFALMCSSVFAFETNLLLIRHGETDWNAETRMQGLTDTSLNEKGVLQAKETAIKLLKNHPDIGVIYSSHLKRAYFTACETAFLFSLPVYKNFSLREFDVGEARGKTKAEILALYGPEDILIEKYPDKKERWNYSLVPGQEVLNDRIQRIRRVLTEISQKHPSEKIAVFTHQGSLIALIADLKDIDRLNTIYVPNCAILQVIYDSENVENPFRIVSLD